MSQGYFSLIQYCPDASRAEGANVGLLIFQAEPALLVVRVVDDVRPVMKRLGRKDDAATLLGVVQSMRNRIERERFGNVEDLVKFVRTRGNQIQLTMPRSMQVGAIERDLEQMFGELVGPQAQKRETRGEVQAPLLRQAFDDLARRMPTRVHVDVDFKARDGVSVHADYAYRNGCLNIVREMPSVREIEALRMHAFAFSRQGQSVRRLEEGEGRLVVVATGDAKSTKEAAREQQFGELIDRLGDAKFVRSADVPAFTKRVEEELAAH